MKNRLLVFSAFLVATSLIVCPPCLSAGSAVDLAAAEAAVRKTDADWGAAGAGVDAWLAFYAADAVVLLPNDRLASGKDLLRPTVSRLLSLPRLSIVWRPIKIEVGGSGDLALLLDAYELRFADSHETLVSDRGQRLEIWRKQADGTWKCSVDTWSSNDAGVAPSVGPPASPQRTSTSAGPTPPPAPVVATKYGDMPVDYEQAIREYFLEHLRHPDSIQIREITRPEQGYTAALTGVVLMREKREYGWTVKATINAKNSHDSYVGFRTYTFLFRGEKIVDVRLPLPGDEMN